MLEGQARGVQELALQPEQARGAVLRIAADGVTDRLQMDADLVRAPCVEMQPQQRCLCKGTVKREVSTRCLLYTSRCV